LTASAILAYTFLLEVALYCAAHWRPKRNR